MQIIEGHNLIDLFIAGILLIGFLFGIWKGFVRSLTALASLVLGVTLALKYYPHVEPYLGKVSSLDPQISMILSMVIVFIGVQIVFVGIRRLLDALIDLTKLSWLDRILGAVMGLVAAFLLVGSAVEVMLAGVPEWSMLKESKLVPPVHGLSLKALSLAPEGAREHLQTLSNRWKGLTENAPHKGRGQGVARESPPRSSPTVGPGKSLPAGGPPAPR